MTTATERTGSVNGNLTPEQGRLLVRIARESLAEALKIRQGQEQKPRTSYDEPWLQQPGATFVTLMEHGELRGCVGSIQAYRPLIEDLRHNARAAAFSDPRFSPVQPHELAHLSVEVSLLSPPEPFPVESEEDAVARLRPGVDGVILEHGPARSTFLPQVWEQLPDPRQFLAYLKQKAGLQANFWSPQLRLQRYTVTKYKDDLER
jgi:AmmeMemoRadiSam system protein A